MTTAQGYKLYDKLGDIDIADGLVAAGLGTPGAIEAADNSAIEAAVGSENVAAVRSIWPAQE